jgi:8-amino-7-oxononanoate synthase
MLDFTSALYLDLRHASWELQPWAQFTTGRPAALASPPGAHTVAQRLASLQGCASATLAPSTLHIFWDLFAMLCRGRGAIYMDAGIYPMARWGIERAAARGVLVQTFAHHNAQALRRRVQQDAHRRAPPVVVADGFCPGCGGLAPIAAYLEGVRACDGRLILDDTQALGILGHAPRPDAPYGKGGGGSLRWSEVGGPDVVLVSSLAKGFGVPVAVLAGSDAMVRRFEAESETRVHSSPPSIAVIRAAEHALAVNHEQGDTLRQRLATLVRRLRLRLAEAGFSATGGMFPVQTLAPLPKPDAMTLHQRLLRLGVRTVLHHGRNGHDPRLSLLITARHCPGDIDRAVEALTYAAGIYSPWPQRWR